jgi:4-carboxymuconolactone decarboxylase
MDHGRLHWFEPDELDEGQRRLYDAVTGGPRGAGPKLFDRTDESGRLHGPFNAMLFDSGVGDAQQALGAALRFGADIPGRTRELTILLVAAHARSEYEWYAHRAVGRSVGLSEEEIEALRTGGEATSFSDEERLVRRVVADLITTRDLDDALFAEASSVLGDRLVVALVALVGYYEATALSLGVFRVPLPPGIAPAFS